MAGRSGRSRDRTLEPVPDTHTLARESANFGFLARLDRIRLAHGTKTASVRLLDDSSSVLRRWFASHACLRRPLGSTPSANVRGLGDGTREVAAGLMESRKKRGLATIQPGLMPRPSPENRTVAFRNKFPEHATD